MDFWGNCPFKSGNQVIMMHHLDSTNVWKRFCTIHLAGLEYMKTLASWWHWRKTQMITKVIRNYPLDPWYIRNIKAIHPIIVKIVHLITHLTYKCVYFIKPLKKKSEKDRSKFHWSFGDHEWFFTTICRVVEIFQSGNKVVAQLSDQHCHPMPPISLKRNKVR